MRKLPLLFAILVLAPLLARAQVELVYKTPTQELLITAVQGGLPLYQNGAQRLPIPADGHLELKKAKDYAPLKANMELYYRMRHEPATLRGSGRIAVAYSLNLINETKDYLPNGLYYVCVWEVNGKPVQIVVKNFPIGRRNQIRTDGTMQLRAGEESGFLRAYLFMDGASLSGVTKANVKSDAALPNFIALKSLLDAGDREGVLAWVKSFSKLEIPAQLLMLAAHWGDPDVLDALLTGTPSAKLLRGREGSDILQKAIGAGRLQAVDVLIKYGAKADVAGLNQYMPLQVAIEVNSPAMVERLLTAGAKSDDHTYRNDETPLLLAIKMGSPEAVDVLLNHGAKWPSSKGELSEWLAYALSTPCPTNVDWLLKQGANPNYRSDSKTPLILKAALTNRMDFIEALLRAGADVNASDSEGITALMTSAYAGNQAAVELLLKAGAVPSLVDKNKRTATAWAIIGGSRDIVGLLKKVYTPDALDLSHQLHEAVLAGETELMEQLRSQGALLDPKTDDVYDVVLEAVRTGNIALIKDAVGQKIDVNQRIWNDWTLAGAAQRYGRSEVVEIFRQQAGEGLRTEAPMVSKLPVQVAFRSTSAMPEELQAEGVYGEAKIDVFIDHYGRPVLPIIRSCTDPRLGRYAMIDVLRWRFNDLGDDKKSWRRVIVPIIYSKQSAAEGDSKIYNDWDLDQSAVIANQTNESWRFSRTESVQVAWANFTINRAGGVVAPRIICSSSAGVNEPALEFVRDWKYRPGIRNGNLVWSLGNGIIVMPQGKLITPGVIFALDELTPDSQLPKIIQTGSSQEFRVLKQDKGLKAAVILLAYTVGVDGKARDIRALASSDAEATHQARLVCIGSEFEPGKKDGRPIEMNVIQCITYGSAFEFPWFYL